jgi:hypothetical protein
VARRVLAAAAAPQQPPGTPTSEFPEVGRARAAR